MRLYTLAQGMVAGNVPLSYMAGFMAQEWDVMRGYDEEFSAVFGGG